VPAVYSAPLSGINPLVASTQTVDAVTGEIVIVPTTTQVGVICLQVEEYRNGNKIGEIVRDLQFTVTDCQFNTLPILSGINGSADSTGTTGDYNIQACAGEEVSFKLQGFDAEAVPSNPFQNIEIKWNFGIQGASFITDYNLPYPESEFKWTPSAADVGTNIFFVSVGDDACPFNASNVYTYRVDVLPALSATIIGYDSTTVAPGDTILLEASTPANDVTYSWAPSTDLSCTDCASPMVIASSTTVYTVTITSLVNGCSTTEEVEITVQPISTREVPQSLSSMSIFPNPMTDNSTLNYELSESGLVSIQLFDVLGQQIAILADERQLKGEYQYNLGKYLISRSKGIYFITMEINGQSVTKKLFVQ
ncbi:MAG: T9SS type A sorting domain-containing protein, partial [Saprospiraceae bacterium]